MEPTEIHPDDNMRNRDDLHPSVAHVLQFFVYGHLPPWLQHVSKPFAEMAEHMVETLPENPELTVALRKLLESKDAAVRARVIGGG